MLVGVIDNDKCVYAMVRVQGAILAHITSIKVVSRRLPREVTPYETHTAEESHRRRRSGRHSQVLPGTEGTLARAASTTSEGLCQGAPIALSCRHLVRPPHDVDNDIHWCTST
jgi:hypothetical protein